MTQLPECLRLNLADALSGHVELPAHFLQRPGLSVIETEPQAEHLLLPLGQRGKRLHQLFVEEFGSRRIDGNFHIVILYKIAKVAVFFLSDGCLQGNRILGNLHDFPHAVDGNLHALRDLLRLRLSAQLLQKLTGGPHKTVNGLNHVNGNPDRPRLVGDRAGDGLTDPPGGVGTELESLLVIVLFHRLQQAQVSLLDQIQELHAPAHIALGNADHQTEICFREALSRLLIALVHAAGILNLLLGGKQRHLADLLQIHSDRVRDADALRHTQGEVIHIDFRIRVAALFLLLLQEEVRVHVQAVFRPQHIHIVVIKEVIDSVELFRPEYFAAEKPGHFGLFQHILSAAGKFQKLLQFLGKFLLTASRLCAFSVVRSQNFCGGHLLRRL